MAIGTSNALGAFEAGVAGGKTRGPSGVGGAIRGILENARKVGLLQAQSGFQTAGANQNAILKENREIANNPGRDKLNVIGAAGGVTTEDILPGSKTVSAPGGRALSAAEDMEQMIILRNKMKAQGNPIGNPVVGNPIGGADIVTIQFNDGTTADMPREQAISNGYIQ